MTNSEYEECLECPWCGYLISRHEISLMKFPLDVCPRCGLEYLANFKPHKMKEDKINLNRNFLEWEWYQDNNAKSIFLHCLLKACLNDCTWAEHKIKRGQFITTYKRLESETGLTVQQIRTALKKLIRANELTCESSNKYTVITVIRFDEIVEGR